MDLPRAVKDRLEEVRNRTEADTITEVVRRALRVYDVMTLQGREPELMLEDGTKFKLLLY